MATKRFLIPDGYNKESRARFAEVRMRPAWQLYRDLLVKYIPDAEYDVWLSSDEETPDSYTIEELKQYDGILWPGCNLTVYHDVPEVKRHIDTCQKGFEAGIPQFGSCWAIQVAAVACGGECGACDKGREMGVGQKVLLNEDGVTHPMYAGKPRVFSHFMSHDDEVKRMPEGGTILASNGWSKVQSASFKYRNGEMWAVQYHPEYDLNEVARLIEARDEKLIKLGFFKDLAALKEYTGRLDALVAEPDRKDFRWQLGIDDDIMDDGIRELEFANWVKHFFG
ncbi:MAG: gamma-glutamyl-gamma-aminobutyrate hydrolase family protein [Candidatus Hydrogenedentes bacterium]|nr:gamma-glutamyl-gamma-aminobutyrate hydrolase family protein [Candidatus Hydrogenedentota bacterium]